MFLIKLEIPNFCALIDKRKPTVVVGWMEFIKMSKGQEKLLKIFVWSTVVLNAATLICISIIAKRLSS